MVADKIIQVKHVSFTYPDSKTKAASDVSFDIKKGTWTAIVGHNGSGKSTITRLLNGLLLPDKNPETKIIIDGQELNEETVWDIRDKIGIVFQNPDNQFVGATVADDVAFGLENRGVPRDQMIKTVKWAVEQVGMSDYFNAEPANLSGGQKQRVAIAGILAIQPKIIILDEATSMLDPSGRKKVLNLVKKMKDMEDLTVLSITHDVNEAFIADQVLLLNDGKLINQDEPVNVFSQTKLINDLGLEEPFIFKLKDKLKSVGIKIPENVNTEEKLIEILCQLNSKM
ncbi:MULTISPECIES: energy-coupling factor ABC transporter ATP-binding protein [Lactobacillus]|uniref:Energy-coupling factor transporter ATPase n=1 Tax=Lactobacillus xujianguonis TaxID=2495899 RepID=A0A437SV91_9LACO|nr:MULTISPECIES: energy-coupling factor ABC transporter ATP-binding protein [Lactobacillus]RVU70846.1 energy-coupling factor transporter ATPase [Lactobacillus xujianguonis]RVU77077.1 energy-coupling factor transporter ATPase [Lactobacillus xujianguonis]